MEMRVTNRKDDGTATAGQLFVDDQFVCDTLEPPITAEYPRIPAGRYPVEFWFSGTFQEIVPHICNVPGRDLIEIHPGNKPTDTHGCLLVGKGGVADWISTSRATFLRLMQLIRQCAPGELFITYEEVS